MKFVLLVFLLFVVLACFYTPVQQVFSDSTRYPVYLDPPAMYLDQDITYDEWPQE